MRRLASQLSSIRISLDPPSPPYISLSPEENSHPHSGLYSDMNYLQVPPVECELQRNSSPPPDRRSSFASTTSDCSSITIPMSSSYQSLLSPMWTSAKYSIDECETPPYEPISRPRSAQFFCFDFSAAISVCRDALEITFQT
ncbi:unnamed protein product [Nippostrongylus brasiliensis]|uniref:Uncharacterized protein n=1 Tax=Nippostrongylus brasiliensis TaxID=27835 RepID=A0A0N4YDE7_NIPBR|nr:unnamed protein product [Nippostrongylus brasiliensis]